MIRTVSLRFYQRVYYSVSQVKWIIRGQIHLILVQVCQLGWEELKGDNLKLNQGIVTRSLRQC